MLRKLTKKDAKSKKILNDRIAFSTECYADCLEWCVVNNLMVTNDHQMSAWN